MIDFDERDVDFIVDEEEWEARTAREDSLEEIAKTDPLWARWLDGDR